MVLGSHKLCDGLTVLGKENNNNNNNNTSKNHQPCVGPNSRPPSLSRFEQSGDRHRRSGGPKNIGWNPFRSL